MATKDLRTTIRLDEDAAEILDELMARQGEDNRSLAIRYALRVAGRVLLDQRTPAPTRTTATRRQADAAPAI